MDINSYRPVQRSAGFDKNSVSDMNKVSKAALEAVADFVYDVDGDNTGLKDVNKALGNLSGDENIAYLVGTVATGGALPVLSLIGEGLVDGVKYAANGIVEVSKQVKKTLD